jgi:hypothetical protein
VATRRVWPHHIWLDCSCDHTLDWTHDRLWYFWSWCDVCYRELFHPLLLYRIANSSQFFTGTYIVDAYPLHSASGMAASSLLRSLIGGLAPLFATKLYRKLDVAWAFTLLACIALLFVPIPWICYRYGENWRRRERYSTGVDGERSGTGVSVSAESELK